MPFTAGWNYISRSGAQKLLLLIERAIRW